MEWVSRQSLMSSERAALVCHAALAVERRTSNRRAIEELRIGLNEPNAMSAAVDTRRLHDAAQFSAALRRVVGEVPVVQITRDSSALGSCVRARPRAPRLRVTLQRDDAYSPQPLGETIRRAT